MDSRERNALMNRYLREARERGIVGPYRADEYARHRLKGKTPEQAEALTRKSKK